MRKKSQFIPGKLEYFKFFPFILTVARWVQPTYFQELHIKCQRDAYGFQARIKDHILRSTCLFLIWLYKRYKNTQKRQKTIENPSWNLFISFYHLIAFFLSFYHNFVNSGKIRSDIPWRSCHLCLSYPIIRLINKTFNLAFWLVFLARH